MLSGVCVHMMYAAVCVLKFCDCVEVMKASSCVFVLSKNYRTRFMEAALSLFRGGQKPGSSRLP